MLSPMTICRLHLQRFPAEARRTLNFQHHASWHKPHCHRSPSSNPHQFSIQSGWSRYRTNSKNYRFNAVMDGKSAPVPPLSRPVQLDTSALPDTASSSLWDRLTAWASENKSVVYTIAGVTLVLTAGGVVYYITNSDKTSSEPSTSTSTKNKAKKARKKAKKEAEEATAKKDGESAKTGQLCL